VSHLAGRIAVVLHLFVGSWLPFCQGGPVLLRFPAANRLEPGGLSRGFELLIEDRILEAKQIAQRALAVNPDDPEALALAGTVEVYLLDLDRAQQHFDRATRSGRRSFQLALRHGDLEMARGNFKAAQRDYELALKIDGRSALARLNLAATMLQDQQVEKGKALLSKAFELGLSTREEKITALLTRFLLGDVEGTEKAVALYLESNPPVATILFVRAMVTLRSGHIDQAVELLRAVADKGIQNAAIVFQVANLYVALNRVADAHELLGRALKLHTRSTKLADQLRMVAARFLSAGQTKTLLREPFEVTYEVSTSPDLLDRILDQCKRHYESLANRMSIRPTRIVLKIFDSTGFTSPAYYNNLTGDITISGSFFRQAQGHIDGFVSHAFNHELAHLFVWNAKNQTTRSVNCLWIDEGLAEFLSGGVDYLRDLPLDLASSFADGPLAMSDLIGNINMLWHDKTKNVKAYVQSYYMVDYLMEKAASGRTALVKIQDLLDRVARDVPLEQAIVAVYGMAYVDFEKGWRSHLSSRLSGGE